MNDETSKRIGDYEILSVLGAGGMGRVYKVRNVISDRVEAMKILLPDLAGRQELAERFLREIKLLATLDHPNIAALRTALTLNNQLVMVMEYMEGITLSECLEKGPMASADAVNYISQVLSALSYAHQRQIIHRDIKPSNMMLTPQGVVKLMDFGIARSGNDPGLTMTGTTLGSLYYMSPEQVKGSTADARSDIYSVGVSLYEMVTGQRPFQADSNYSILAAHLEQAPKPPISIRGDLSAELNEIILLAMEKDPARRFQSADSFRTALKSIGGSAGAGLVLTPASPPEVGAAVGGSATGLFGQQPVTPSAGNTPILAHATPAGRTLGDAPFAPPTGHRGLYMSMGALIVLVVLVAAGLYVPHYRKARASEQSPTASEPSTSGQPVETQQTPSATSADNPPPTSGDSNTTNQSPGTSAAPGAGGGDNATIPPSTPTPPPAEASDKKDKDTRTRTKVVPERQPHTLPPRQQSGNPGVGGDTNVTQDAAASGAAQREQLEQQFDQISSRTNAVGSSLDNLQRQQAAQGLGLRGDIAGAQERLRTYNAKAAVALQNQDFASAQRYMNLAEPELEKIEKFLGH